MSIVEPMPLRWTREDYYRLAETGVLRERRVQLIEGEIIEMAPQRNEHAVAIELAHDALRGAFPTGHRIRIQSPLALSPFSEPEPDLAIVKGSARHSTGHPTSAVLVLEVADTTLRLDRTRKTRIYAEAGIAEYWILNLPDRCLEVRRNPSRSSSDEWSYADIATIPADGAITPLAAAQASIAVADLLP
jgi:Uma2 family endonuclease